MPITIAGRKPGHVYREDITGIRLQVVQVNNGVMRFTVIIQVEGKDFYILPEQPTVAASGDEILVRFPENPVITIS